MISFRNEEFVSLVNPTTRQEVLRLKD